MIFRFLRMIFGPSGQQEDRPKRPLWTMISSQEERSVPREIPKSLGGGDELLGLCRTCGTRAVVVRLVDDRITVMGPYRTYTCQATSADVADALREALRAGKAAPVAAAVSWPAGWLDHYCYTCDAFYCANHYRSELVFGEGGYTEDTKGCCPEDHWQSIAPRP